MRFGKTLRNAIYPPWRDNYIDYSKLKQLLREADVDSDKAPASAKPSDADQESPDDWTEREEGAFVEELVNVQLEKVNSFHADVIKRLKERMTECESKLELTVGPRKDSSLGADLSARSDGEEKQKTLHEVLDELDSITKEVNELEKYSRINFSGFLKAAKKHDRKRGLRYRVRPLLQVRLATLPFNSEDYSPLLYRLSTMYSFVRQNLDGDEKRGARSSSASQPTGDAQFVSYKFWVHADNVLEVKTFVLRRLPVLVYNPQASKVADGSYGDPTITSLYFDNPKFQLYSQKIEKSPGASSIRLRWYGLIDQKPEILMEKKTMKDGDDSEVIRFPIKEKYIQPFIAGDYTMEKSAQKLRDRNASNGAEAEKFEKNVEEIQKFITDNNLSPVLRANYTRTAFQIPGDDRIRVSLDTNVALIREDALDEGRPCRDAGDWHRPDIDANEIEYPFNAINKGEICRFPHALLEIKVRENMSQRSKEWVFDLMSSHLVKEAPRFSKFVHGVAALFEDYVQIFPFWLSELDQDIRKDPEKAFEEEQEKKAKRLEDEIAVGSFVAGRSFASSKPLMESPMMKGLDPDAGRADAKSKGRKVEPQEDEEEDEEPEDSVDDREQPSSSRPGGILDLLPSFSSSRYGRAHRARVELPAAVKKPETLIKDSGPVKVEPKVWLANQRTFIKWQHISVLLATLSLGLYNAAGRTNAIARSLAVAYTLIALFAAAWGWWMYASRSRLIRERSGRDLDNIVGPVVVCICLIVALCINFGLKYRVALEQMNERPPTNGSSAVYDDTLVWQELKLVKQGGR